MTPRLSLSEHGRAFATRGLANQLRESFAAQLPGHAVAIIDFAGVTNVTYSFADELVGKLAVSGDTQIEPTNMSSTVADTVERAVARRRASTVVC